MAYTISRPTVSRVDVLQHLANKFQRRADLERCIADNYDQKHAMWLVHRCSANTWEEAAKEALEAIDTIRWSRNHD